MKPTIVTTARNARGTQMRNAMQPLYIIEEAIPDANDEIDLIKCNGCRKWFHQFGVGVDDVAEDLKCFEH